MKVLISYAREDIEIARKLRDDLEKAGIKTWLDKEDLLPGQKWRDVISREIRESSYFIALLSSGSLSKHGFVQSELRKALDALKEFPSDQIFVIPVRIDDCKPQDEQLQNLHWADLFPSYEEGLKKILRVLLQDHQIHEGKEQIHEKEDTAPNKHNEANFKKYEQIRRRNPLRVIMERLYILFSIMLMLFSILWTILMPSVQVSVELMTSNISVILDKDWIAHHNFVTDKIFINNLQEIKALGLNFSKTATDEKEMMSAELKGKNIVITGLELATDSELEMTAQGDTLKMFVKKSPIKGQFLITQGKISIDAGNKTIEKSADFEIPETVSFSTFKTVGNPVLIELYGEEHWQLRNLQIREINFFQEIRPATGLFESTIISGKIKLPQTGYADELREGDSLIIKSVRQNRRLEISKGEKGLKIFFEGSVSKISAGPKGIERNLMPNWLEYLYYYLYSQKRLILFWGIMTYLFIFLWWFKANRLNRNFQN